MLQPIHLLDSHETVSSGTFRLTAFSAGARVILPKEGPSRTLSEGRELIFMHVMENTYAVET